jgi:hypothetical protein
MNIKNIIPAILLLASLQGYAQSVGVNTDGSTPDNSALLDVKGTTKGILIPRMTEAQRIAIASPANGLMVYQTNNTIGFWVNNGTSGTPNWQLVGGSNSQGIVVYTGTTGGAISQTITDLSIRTIIVTFNGGSGAASSIALTIPAASSYAPGTMLSISVTAYVTANPSWSLISPGSFYHALNFNNASTAGGVSVGPTNGFRIVANGNNWYRVLGQ